ncbi:hypothetical protein WMY93_005290 [Mugilogobius chulae]|uniref:EGF-like domain-containing protein n=1 Tax=Mugilogobius chulae TaxID=88201 RepID=A0AAW0PT84_9GOBI
MFTTSQTSSRTGVFSMLVVLFLLYTTDQVVASMETNQTTSFPAVTNSSLSMHLNKSSSIEKKSHRSCGSDNMHFCANGGRCIYYQNTDEPSCHCQFPYEGDRCLSISSHSYKESESEQLIGIIIGVFMVIFALAIIVYCCCVKRCVNSAPLKISSPETQV